MHASTTTHPKSPRSTRTLYYATYCLTIPVLGLPCTCPPGPGTAIPGLVMPPELDTRTICGVALRLACRCCWPFTLTLGTAWAMLGLTCMALGLAWTGCWACRRGEPFPVTMEPFEGCKLCCCCMRRWRIIWLYCCCWGDVLPLNGTPLAFGCCCCWDCWVL